MAESGVQPQWLSDVLTELSAVANGYTTSRDGALRVLAAVPDEYLRAAGLVRLPAPARTLMEALGHDDQDGACDVCVDFKAEMAAIAENERQAWIATRDVMLRG